MNLNKIKTEFRDWFESGGKGNEYIELLTKKQEIKELRYKRFKKWLNKNKFESLLQRLLSEHDDNYCDKCYDKGVEPHPNNKLNFLIGYVFDNAPDIFVKELDNDFPNQTKEFRDYYFRLVFGQGTMVEIYNKNDLKLLLRL